MSELSLVDDLLKGNARFAASFTGGDMEAPPRRGVAILTCMDARLDPARILGLDIGDAHIIRNAGGRASDDAIRSLVLSQRLLGTVEVVVMHHTNCGMVGLTNRELAERVQSELGVDASSIDFLPFADLEQSVLDDVETLRRSKLIPDEVPITGVIYDVKTGRVSEVVRR